ncbi:MAG TPA: sugar phosphate nucleotidyltransferase, partial [Candidatus Cybelea sp.]|nr:sugar phosphate nucleotidyltransferase [Candidatus Cybelea sp.]
MPSQKLSPIHPVILSGGSGSRLWPLSREGYPKQLLALAGPNSLLQETARRVGDPELFAPPLAVCNHEHRFAIAEQLRDIGVTPQAILLEPEGRNTAAAVAVAALAIEESAGANALVLVLPSDHLVRNKAAFLAAVATAAAAARTGALCTFGIAPTGPETGF